MKRTKKVDDHSVANITSLQNMSTVVIGKPSRL